MNDHSRDHARPDAGGGQASADRTGADGADPDTLRRALLALTLPLAGRAAAQDAALTQPSNYRVVLENDRVRVLEFNSRPGMGVCGGGLHSHPAHLTVLLSPAKVRMTPAGGKPQLIDNQLGDTFWSEAEVHEVENISGKDVRSLIIEWKRATPPKG